MAQPTNSLLQLASNIKTTRVYSSIKELSDDIIAGKNIVAAALPNL